MRSLLHCCIASDCILKRKIQYHYGYFSSGCFAASESTASPLRNEESETCLYIDSGQLITSKACTDQWYLDSGGRIVSAGPDAVCFEVVQNLYFDDNRWYLDLVSCSQQDDDPETKQIFHINSLGHLRNAKLDAENLDVCLKIPDNTTNDTYPVFVECGDTSFFRAEIAWYFDGGDCRFNQYVRNMYSPLQWILISFPCNILSVMFMLCSCV